MNPKLRLPPQSKNDLTPLHEIVRHLEPLLGHVFPFVSTPRTDGSALRRLIAHQLQDFPFPNQSESYRILPEKSKGVPMNLLAFIDSYLVTSVEKPYNLQVWNRDPNTDTPQIECEDGSILTAQDVGLVLVRLDRSLHVIKSIVGMSPKYIVDHFGKFGKATLKYQMTVSASQRERVIKTTDRILFHTDTSKVKAICVNHSIEPVHSFNEWPTTSTEVMSLEVIRELVAVPLVGELIDPANTKNRGQGLERLILELLGYNILGTSSLEGQFPDIKNQLLEIKIQDSPTVDFGRYTPDKDKVVNKNLGVTTKDIRYMIVLMDELSSCVQGIVLMPGEHLGSHFSHVNGSSVKYQRSIPMRFFDTHDGRAVFNP